MRLSQNQKNMPIDPIIGGAAIGAFGNLLGQGANIFASRRANKRMVDFWHMQNEYNHPLQQMARLEEAGLNPNLIYGDSISGATGQAGEVGRPHKPEIGSPLSDITSFANLKARNAQVDLVEQQANTEFQRGVLIAEQQALTGMRTAKTNQEYNQSSELFTSQLQASELNVQNMEQQILGKQLDNDFKDSTLKDRISKIYWEAKNAQKILKGRGLQNELLRLQSQFLRLGLDRNSPWYAKVFGNIINQINK